MGVVYLAPMTYCMLKPACHYHVILVVDEVAAVDILISCKIHSLFL